MTTPIARAVQTMAPEELPDRVLEHRGWKITARKRPILNSREIDEMTADLGIAPPEMIFGNNFVEIRHEESNWGIKFTALEALRRVDKTGERMLKVAYSDEWQAQRTKLHEGIDEVVKPFDWTFTTDFAGETTSPLKPTEYQIPLDKLRRPDPIIFFEDVPLYEDELADNGMSLLSVKVRVMPERLLLLSRFYMRLDDVLFRIRDTRVFVEFATKEVIREYTARELTYAEAKEKLRYYPAEELPAVMRDANKMAEVIPIVDGTLEKIVL